jgi:hypothetical protein
MNRWGYDDVNGTVIGGDFFSGEIFYDSRSQSQKIYGDTEQELITLAEEKVQELKKLQSIGLYQDNSKWELRIYE